MAFWLQKPATLLPEDQCNPGRAAPNPDAAGPDALHFVKGTRLREPFPAGLELAMFGFGCFWCSENVFSEVEGVYSTSVGYAGGVTQNPTYRDVCGGDTNHNEVVRVAFDPAKVSFAELLRTFWSAHNPCTRNRQGNDRGTQYRSGVYYYSDAQRAAALASKEAYGAALRRAGRTKAPVVTEVLPAPTYWIAEAAHQQYDARPGSRDYCGLSPLGVECPPAEEWMPAAPEAAKAAAAPGAPPAAAAPAAAPPAVPASQ